MDLVKEDEIVKERRFENFVPKAAPVSVLNINCACYSQESFTDGPK